MISSLSGAHFVIFVTEPTVSGIHDLKRVYELAKKFHLPSGIIVNKADLNQDKTQEIIDFAKEENIVFLGQIPYDDIFTKAMVAGLSIVEYEDNQISKTITEIWINADRLAFLSAYKNHYYCQKKLLL